MLRFRILVGEREKLILFKKGSKNGETIAADDALTDWTEHYLKNKDLLLKNIVSIQRGDGWTLTVIRKDGAQHILIVPHLTSLETLFSRMQPELNAVLVVLNTHKNLEMVLDNWQALTKFPKLCLIFANPDSSTDKRWVIFPHTHDKITERKMLKFGLESLFSTVEAAV
jgi:precorrin-6B methylase 1